MEAVATDPRRRICEGLEFLGVALDARRNDGNAPLISAEDGRVAIRVIRTDEEAVIARAAAEFIPGPRATTDPDP